MWTGDSVKGDQVILALFLIASYTQRLISSVGFKRVIISGVFIVISISKVICTCFLYSSCLPVPSSFPKMRNSSRKQIAQLEDYV